MAVAVIVTCTVDSRRVEKELVYDLAPRSV